MERQQHRNTDIDIWKIIKAKALGLSDEGNYKSDLLNFPYFDVAYPTDLEKQNSSKNWLRNNQQPAEKVSKFWKESFLLRMRTIVQDADADKTNVLTEWPRLTDDNGYLLVTFC